LTARLFNVEIENILPPTSNPRFAAEELGDLTASIKGTGVLEPLLGVAEGKKVRLVAGKRRLAASKLAGLTTVPMLVHTFLSPRDEMAISLVENLHRKDMTAIELGTAFKKLVADGMSQRQVATLVGVSDFTVSSCVRIVECLIPEMAQLCHEGKLTRTEAYRLCRHPAQVQRAIFYKEAPKAKAPQGRKSYAETALANALACYKDGRKVEALGYAEQAVEHLRRTTDLRVVS
jgi:ParB family chromosome partitioning protein